MANNVGQSSQCNLVFIYISYSQQFSVSWEWPQKQESIIQLLPFLPFPFFLFLSAWLLASLCFQDLMWKKLSLHVLLVKNINIVAPLAKVSSSSKGMFWWAFCFCNKIPLVSLWRGKAQGLRSSHPGAEHHGWVGKESREAANYYIPDQGASPWCTIFPMPCL